MIFEIVAALFIFFVLIPVGFSFLMGMALAMPVRKVAPAKPTARPLRPTQRVKPHASRNMTAAERDQSALVKYNKARAELGLAPVNH